MAPGRNARTTFTLVALFLLAAACIPRGSHALDIRFPVLGIRPSGTQVSHVDGELREAGRDSETSSRQAWMSRNNDKAGRLAFNTAQTSFDSPDKFAKNQGALAQWLGTTDLPVDNMFIFGSLGFLVGYAKSKMSRFLITVGLLGLSVLVMSKNGYVTIHWGKVQKDIAGSETYKFIRTGKAMQLLPPNVQDAISRCVGVVKSAIENNKGGLAVAFSSFLSGMTLGSRA